MIFAQNKYCCTVNKRKKRLFRFIMSCCKLAEMLYFVKKHSIKIRYYSILSFKTQLKKNKNIKEQTSLEYISSLADEEYPIRRLYIINLPAFLL